METEMALQKSMLLLRLSQYWTILPGEIFQRQRNQCQWYEYVIHNSLKSTEYLFLSQNRTEPGPLVSFCSLCTGTTFGTTVLSIFFTGLQAFGENPALPAEYARSLAWQTSAKCSSSPHTACADYVSVTFYTHRSSWVIQVFGYSRWQQTQCSSWTCVLPGPEASQEHLATQEHLALTQT